MREDWTELLCAHPYDEGTLRVYADELIDAGDPLGEILAAHRGHVHATIMDGRVDSDVPWALGELEAYPLRIDLRAYCGFIRAATVYWSGSDRTLPRSDRLAAEWMAMLLEHPQSLLLERLSVGGSLRTPLQADELFAELTKRPPVRLRHLALGDPAEAYRNAGSGALSELSPTVLKQLRSVTLYGSLELAHEVPCPELRVVVVSRPELDAGLVPFVEQAPGLRSLQVRTMRGELEILRKAFRKLEHVVDVGVWLHTRRAPILQGFFDRDVQAPAPDLEPGMVIHLLDELPSHTVRRLTLRSCGFEDEHWDALSRRLQRYRNLRVVDLRGNFFEVSPIESPGIRFILDPWSG